MNIFFEQGEIFSGCKILHRCGQGGYGVVYLAENAIGQKIVIKIVAKTDSSSRELCGLRNYMQVSGTHPNLLQVFHIGEMKEGFYYTMEAADDLKTQDCFTPATLGNMLRNGRKFSPEEAIHIVRELLGGLAIIHDAGLVHRDIKPDNIIFVNGKAKLSDPGLVIPAGSQVSLAGTPGFIPPEIIASALPADVRSDLYALGKVFYCMVTGNHPSEYPHFPADMRIEVRRQLFPPLSQMCNTNPAKRFKSVKEFLNGMPVEIQAPTRWERWKNNFSSWKILNREKYKKIISSLILCTLLLLCAIFVFLLKREQKKQELDAAKNKVRSFRLINSNRKGLLSLQFRVFLPEKADQYQKLISELKKQEQNGQWHQAVMTVDKLTLFLRDAAEKNLPAVPEKEGSFQKDFEISGAARSFLAAPLAAYLPAEKKKAYMEKLQRHEKVLYAGWAGPRCDRNWFDLSDYPHPLIFIPAGVVEMEHSGKTVKIPYHFWMCQHEITHEYFSRMVRISPQKSTKPRTPVERVAWNDVLNFCRVLTLTMKNNRKLPPGYIVRPPTEAEWEYAAKNAWKGKDTLPFEERAVFKDNSQKQTHTPGTKAPSKLGLLDIYGNVAEMVIPFEEPALANAVMVRGGSFRSTEKVCFRQLPYLKYQFLPDDIGFRTVVAPGDMSFFDKHFFISGPTALRDSGKVYELIGGNLGSFRWREAEQLAGMLGGRLAEIRDQKQFDLIRKKMPLALGGWPCLLNGEKVNGKWIWRHSKREIDFGKWYPSRGDTTGKYLSVINRVWRPEKDLKCPLFLCEWDEKDFPRRTENIRSGKKQPLELTRFSLGNKNYMLINISVIGNTAVRLCELMGGRLACPDTPELKAAVIRHLKDYSHLKILLGGYAKFDQWFWLSGKEIREKIPPKPVTTLPSLNRNFIVLKGGRFWNSQLSEAFLLEWSNSSASSN